MSNPLNDLALLNRMIDDLPEIRLRKEFDKLAVTEAARYQKLLEDASGRNAVRTLIQRHKTDAVLLENAYNKYSRQTIEAFDRAVRESSALRTAESEFKRLTDRLNQPFHEVVAQLAAQKRLQEQVGADLANARIWSSRFETQISQLVRYVSENPLPDVQTGELDQLRVNGEPIAASEIAPALKEYAAAETRETALAVLLVWLAKSKPAVRVLLLYFLLPYVISIVANLTTPMYEEWWKKVRESTPREAKKEIVAVARAAYLPQDLRDFRFVRSKKLAVRSSPRMKGPQTDLLELGKTVRLLNEQRAWAFVEYATVGTEELKQGWVLARYLSPFR